jgi:hypothetical protein
VSLLFAPVSIFLRPLLHTQMFCVPVYNLGYSLPSRGKTICETQRKDKNVPGHEGVHTPQLQEEGSGTVIIWETAALIQGTLIFSVSWFIRKTLSIVNTVRRRIKQIINWK